jgi:hypothetical protein
MQEVLRAYRYMRIDSVFHLTSPSWVHSVRAKGSYHHWQRSLETQHSTETIHHSFAQYPWVSIWRWMLGLGPQYLLPGVISMLVGPQGLLFRPSRHVARSCLLLFPSGWWMRTVSSNVCQESCLAGAVEPSRVGRSILSNEFVLFPGQVPRLKRFLSSVIWSLGSHWSRPGYQH